MICMEVDGMKRVLFKVILPLAFIVVWLEQLVRGSYSI